MSQSNFLLQIFNDDKFGCLEEELKLVKPNIPVSKINPNFRYRIWTIIRNKATGEIIDFNQYAGEIGFSDE